MSSPSMTIAQVAASGGTPSASVTTLDPGGRETQHGFPFFLPDGRRFLYVAYRGLVSSGLVQSDRFDGQAPVRLMDTESDAQDANGSLLFVRGTTVMAQPFDSSILALTGEAVVLGERVQTNLSFMRAGGFSASETGALVYQGSGGTGTARLVWSDRSGRQTAVIDERLEYRDLRLSRDGTRAVVSLVNARDGTNDVWMVGGGRELRTRFTFDVADDMWAIWSPDNADIAFASRRNGHLDLYRRTASGSEEALLDDPVDKFPTSWSSDGKFILYSIDDARTGPDVWGAAADRQSEALSVPHHDHRRTVRAILARRPLGRIFLVRVWPKRGLRRALPGTRWQASRYSSGGGGYPRWRSDGRELFYQSPDNRLIAASITVGSDRIAVDAEHPLFEMRAPDGTIRDFYDVASDGQRFMFIVPDETTSNPLTLVNSWPTLMKARR